MKIRICTSLFLVLSLLSQAGAQHGIAREWNEMLIFAIRGDFGRPTVHARNLFHHSVAMYDAWAAYDPIAKPYLLGNTVGNYTCPFDGVPPPADIQEAREEAISYAAYRVLKHRFANSPGNTNPLFLTGQQLDAKMFALGYDISFTGTDYSTGNPAALGNYIAQQVIAYGLQDGANEQFNYANQFYQPVNPPMVTKFPGNPNIVNLNRWQALTLDLFIDQNGNPLPFNTPPALTPEFGNVTPFALGPDDLTVKQRDGYNWNVFHDPGAPPTVDLNDPTNNAEFIWNYALNITWSSHLEPDDNAIWDISPASIGNLAVENLPVTFDEYQNFYRLTEGGTNFAEGHDINPKTGQPYEPQYVTRGDYTRALAEFWADGPNSDTPPGHWFEILNYVMDHPDFSPKYRGQGEELDQLEFEVKAYFMLGGSLMDAAVTAWGIKGFYDSVRPVSAIRAMADLGQSSDPNLSNYHPAGLPLIPGFIEVVQAGDPMIGKSYGRSPEEYIVAEGDIKILAWNGPDSISVPATDEAGVDWTLAKYWWPYQRPTFVSPPFPGFISGHSTYSRTAAEVMTALTGDAYFPGGMGEFICNQNQFLVFEDGPSQTIKLQWATYRDASDQCSLSRIWGGIHPPADDIPGRLIGIELAADAVAHAETYFFNDEDQDGFYNYVDCNDLDAAINPSAVEICDDLDNDCSGAADDGLEFNNYFLDADGDGFGNQTDLISSCATSTPVGYSPNNSDCDDASAAINPDAAEVCDNIDNDCSGAADDNIPYYLYFLDADGDGFGDADTLISSCLTTAPVNYVSNSTDCDDANSNANPSVSEVCDNVDNDCNGATDDGIPYYTFYLDADSDGFGVGTDSVTICLPTAPDDYTEDAGDCDDTDAGINPDGVEICDGVDNNCTGQADESLPVFIYYVDADGDGFGDTQQAIESCETTAPNGYTTVDGDCNDANAAANPDASEVMDGIDNDCDGEVDETNAVGDLAKRNHKLFPNPTTGGLNIEYEFLGELSVQFFRPDGRLLRSEVLDFTGGIAKTSLNNLPQGVYLLVATDAQGQRHIVERVVKL